jgi:hypothetical protein
MFLNLFKKKNNNKEKFEEITVQVKMFHLQVVALSSQIIQQLYNLALKLTKKWVCIFLE